MRPMPDTLTAAQAAYLYWVTRGHTVSEARVKAVTPWDKLPVETRDSWVDFATHILNAVGGQDDATPA